MTYKEMIYDKVNMY